MRSLGERFQELPARLPFGPMPGSSSLGCAAPPDVFEGSFFDVKNALQAL